ncbi:MAG TPA: acyl carrier protein [Vicinamibacterales bacterium]|jgi:acyl carrier protein
MRTGSADPSPDQDRDAAIRQRLREFLLSTFYVPEVDHLFDDTSLLEAGIVDSTGILEILAFLRTDFGVNVEDSEVTPDNFETIGRQVRFVARKLAASSAQLG